MSPVASPSGGARNRRKTELLIFLFVLVVVGPLIHAYTAQQASRYLLTAAIWDDHTFELDRYAEIDPPVLGRDRAVRDGHTYSDKAPLQPMLAVPFYAVYRWVGGDPVTEQRVDEHLGLWWLTFWMASVPLAVLAVLMFRFCSRYAGRRASLIGVLGVVFGSILLPFGALLFGHVLAALFGFAAFYLLTKEGALPRHLVGGGLLAGAAVATDYTAAILVVILGGLAAWQHREHIRWFLVGGVPGGLLLAWYHTVVFGTPLTHPYRWSAFSGVRSEVGEVIPGFNSFHLDNVFELLFHGRGFLFGTPIVLIGIAGLVAMFRKRVHTDVAIVGLLVFLGFLSVPLFWVSPWGGDSPGARYMLPALPFLAVGLAFLWERLGRWARYVTGLSVATMVAATLTDPILSRASADGLLAWIDVGLENGPVPTLFTVAFGPLGWIVQVALVGIVGSRLARTIGRSRRTS